MPYQVNAALMARAKDHAIFMHCMPIHQNEEVTPDVLATPASVIYDEAENRLHAQKSHPCMVLRGRRRTPAKNLCDYNDPYQRRTSSKKTTDTHRSTHNDSFF